jgi:hypothetical protein
MMGNVVSARPTIAQWHPGLGAGTVDTLLTKAPSIAAGAAVSTGVIAAGSALSIALPVVGIALGAIIGSLFAAHAARVAGAKQENTVLNSLIPTVSQAITAVFTAANAGQVSASDAISAIAQIKTQFWQAVQQVEGGPGQAGGPNKCVAQTDTPGPGVTCDKSCTASCCVGCNVINEWCYNATRAFQQGGGSGPLPWQPVVGNKYGLTDFSPPSGVTYTPPPPGSVAASVSGISSLASGSVAGIPLWMILAGLLAWKVL